MELPIHKFQDIKTGMHIFQGVLIFVAWAMTIALFRTGTVDARIGWEFGLCFLSIPGLIFLTMPLRFPRTQKLAHPYALVTIDAVYTILWISGFACVASWNTDGFCKKNCGVAKAVVGLGVFVFLCFALTTAMSIYGVKYYLTNGVLPGASRAPYSAEMIDPDKEAFSTNIGPSPHEHDHDDEYAPVQNHEDLDLDHHGAGGDQFNTAYMGAGGYANESRLEGSDGGYGGAEQEHSGRVHFPPANYAEGRTPIAI